MFDLSRISLIRPYETRSASAENPTGGVGMGALANVGDDEHTTDAATDLGRGWKVRPCLRIRPGQTHILAEIKGPGVIEHMWMTVDPERSRLFTLRVYYDDLDTPSIECPVSDFFANGINGRARIASLPIAVNPAGGMNSYWPMPFQKRIRITISNDWPTPHPLHPDDPREEFFYQITWSSEPVADDAGYFHAQWRRAVTAREHPELTILDGVRGEGHYVGTYLIWQPHSSGWWGEGEVKFFIDGDAGTNNPTICGTGTEDYFGGAWGFSEPGESGRLVPLTYSTPFLGYPQTLFETGSASLREASRHSESGATVHGHDSAGGVSVHGMYRWHIPDPIRFRKSLRITCQALGWLPTKKYQALTDDVISLAFWYQRGAATSGTALPPASGRLLR